MPDRVVCVVQARQGSSRLPGKALRMLQGRPLIAHVLERAAAVPGVHAVVLATTVREEDDGLAGEVAAMGYAVVRGSSEDVLDRMLTAATVASADVVVRVTGDCPLLAPEVAGLVVARHLACRTYAWNDTAHSGYPDGTDAEAFAAEELQLAHLYAREPGDREHVTPWIRRTRPVAVVRSEVDYSWLKTSVDTLLDYERVQAIACRLAPGDWSLGATVRAYEVAALAAGEAVRRVDRGADLPQYRRW